MTNATELDEAAVREDVDSILADPTPDPTAEWWATKADLLLDEITRLRAALDEARAEQAYTYRIARKAHARAEAAESALAAVRGALARFHTSDDVHAATILLASRCEAALATPTTTDEGDDR